MRVVTQEVAFGVTGMVIYVLFQNMVNLAINAALMIYYGQSRPILASHFAARLARANRGVCRGWRGLSLFWSWFRWGREPG